MKRLLSFTLRVAKSEASTVLIEGESGTGKDLMAQFLHYSSNRRTGPFIALNCSAIPEALLESELFGREPGAYTDARSQKKGLLEVAHGGTLFLDEIGDLSPAVQAKFLRVLEQQSFRRLGGLQDINVDLRVVAATNRDLSGAVQSGTFRLDLFHRLSVIQIAPPPLRDHPEDILPLASHFVQEHNRRYKAHIEGISPDAAKILEAYRWPGNVRELRNVIERAILLEETNLLQTGSIQFASSRALPEPATSAATGSGSARAAGAAGSVVEELGAHADCSGAGKNRREQDQSRGVARHQPRRAALPDEKAEPRRRLKAPFTPALARGLREPALPPVQLFRNELASRITLQHGSCAGAAVCPRRPRRGGRVQG